MSTQSNTRITVRVERFPDALFPLEADFLPRLARRFGKRKYVRRWEVDAAGEVAHFSLDRADLCRGRLKLYKQLRRAGLVESLADITGIDLRHPPAALQLTS